jgi:hypothetical protein
VCNSLFHRSPLCISVYIIFSLFIYTRVDRDP